MTQRRSDELGLGPGDLDGLSQCLPASGLGVGGEERDAGDTIGAGADRDVDDPADCVDVFDGGAHVVQYGVRDDLAGATPIVRGLVLGAKRVSERLEFEAGEPSLSERIENPGHDLGVRVGGGISRLGARLHSESDPCPVGSDGDGPHSADLDPPRFRSLLDEPGVLVGNFVDVQATEIACVRGRSLATGRRTGTRSHHRREYRRLKCLLHIQIRDRNPVIGLQGSGYSVAFTSYARHNHVSAMKAVIPLAGKGTRLRPHTHHTPKPLLKVAGKPVLAYILDDLVELGVGEVIFIVGHLRGTVEEWISTEYPDLTAHYVVQEVQDGTAGAIALAEPFVDEDVLIIFADAVLEVDYGLTATLGQEYGAVIWAKEVEDYQRYGVIVTNDDGTMQTIVEKPSEPVSRLANIGLYYIRDHELLFEGVRHTLGVDPGPSGEFYLTDAFQYMVDHGSRLITAPVDGWWDAGKPETLLETNGHLVATRRGGVDPSATIEDAEIVDPVRIESGVVVRGGRIGPNVTLETGTVVENSEIENAVVGPEAKISSARLHDSIIGGHATISNIEASLLVTDHSVVAG